MLYDEIIDEWARQAYEDTYAMLRREDEVNKPSIINIVAMINEWVERRWRTTSFLQVNETRTFNVKMLNRWPWKWKENVALLKVG